MRFKGKSSAQDNDKNQELNDRAVRLGSYIVEHEATVRGAALAFGISKSTVHKDISVRLPAIHDGLYRQVRDIIEKNKQERHIRGGLATKRKYEKQRQFSDRAPAAPHAAQMPRGKLKKTAFPP